MSRFSYLYYFDSDELTLIESKRVDIPTSASLSEVYKWTVYFKKRDEFHSLNFRSMKKNDGEEFRSFKEGELHFNQQSGEFTMKDKTYQLDPAGPEQIPESLKNILEDYLVSLPHQL